MKTNASKPTIERAETSSRLDDAALESIAGGDVYGPLTLEEATLVVDMKIQRDKEKYGISTDDKSRDVMLKIEMAKDANRTRIAREGLAILWM